MKTSKLCLVALTLVMAVSCVRTSIKGKIADVDTLVVKVWTGEYLQTLDTLALTESGEFSCNLDIKEGDPRFVYLYKGSDMLTPLVVERGDKIVLGGSEKGGLTIEGSPASLEIQKLSVETLSALSSLVVLSDEIDGAVSKAARAEITRKFNKIYVEHYRSRVKFLMEHPYSINNIVVLNERLGNLAIFSRPEDAIYFRTVADSLETVYPNSTYVKILKKDASDRMAALTISQQLSVAEELDFPEISLPGVDGQNISLTETVNSNRLTIVYFWDSYNAANNVFNSDYLKKIYAKYHSQGLEIYAVSIDTDKSAWARAVKDQKLGWKNVCDGLGVQSSVLALYNLQQIPTLFFITPKGILTDEKITKPEQVEPLVKKYL